MHYIQEEEEILLKKKLSTHVHLSIISSCIYQFALVSLSDLEVMTQIYYTLTSQLNMYVIPGI